MSRVYKATGINLKSMPLGESDRLLTILTREYGLIRAVAPGARKTKSKFGGRSALFVVNQLVLNKGRSLDKVSQAETLASYPGLSRNLATLTASQYLAELTLYQALTDQPQAELLDLLCQQLERLEHALSPQILPTLVQSIFQLLVWAGVAPQVHTCCRTHQPLAPQIDNPAWQVGFSPSEGGTIALSAWTEPQRAHGSAAQDWTTAERAPTYGGRWPKVGRRPSQPSPLPNGGRRLSALELNLLQQLAQAVLNDAPTSLPWDLALDPIPDPGGGDHQPHPDRTYPLSAWLAVEQALRHYAQYYLERPIRSADLIEACFTPVSFTAPVTTP